MDLSSIITFAVDFLPFLIDLAPDLIASSQGDTDAGSAVLSSVLSSEYASSLSSIGSSLLSS